MRTNPDRMILRARLVVPISRPPIADGAIFVGEGVIREVGRWRDLAGRRTGAVMDLGEVALVPGLVNAHCHLDYTHMAGQLVPPRSFTDWIKCITELKLGWSFSDFAESWRAGARMLVATGTTTVGDIEAVPDLLPQVWRATPLRVLTFLELTGVRSRRQPEVILAEALDKITQLPPGRNRAWLSPHAPYSTTPELMRLSSEVTRERSWRWSTHVAESAEEYEMFSRAQGLMFDWLARNERAMTDCGGASPVQRLAQLGVLGDQLLAVHANYLAPGDAELLAQHGVHVIHCPRSHAYFGHRPFPAEALVKAGCNVSLGTDSLATVLKSRREQVELDLFAEMRAFAAAHSGFDGEAILRLATVNGARALGLQGRAGELATDAFADAITIPFQGPEGEVYDAVVHHAGPVRDSMIDGHWVHGPAAAAGQVGPEV